MATNGQTDRYALCGCYGEAPSQTDSDLQEDLLQYCTEEAINKGYSDESLVLRILAANIAALHTSTLVI